MPGEDRFHAETTIARDEGGPDILVDQPGQQFPAAGVQFGILCRMLLMPQEHRFSFAASRLFHFSESFQNRAIGNSHLRLDPWKIEHRLCESAVHVE
jgi:hypothetical protein